MEAVLAYKNGNGSKDLALQAALKEVDPLVQGAAKAHQRIHRTELDTSRSLAQLALWKLMETWKPSKGIKFVTYVYRHLVKKTIHIETTGRLNGGFNANPPLALPDGASRHPWMEDQTTTAFPNLDQNIVSSLTKTELDRTLVDFWSSGYRFQHSLKLVEHIEPNLDPDLIRAAAQGLRDRIRLYITTNYPILAQGRGRRTKLNSPSDVTTPAPETTKTTTPPPAADAGKKAAPKKAPAKKANGGSKPMAPKKADPKKADPKKAAPTAKTAKAKAPAKPAAKKAAPTAKTAKAPEPIKEMPEGDLKEKIEKVNSLVAEQDGAVVKNDWKIGKILCEIREKVNDGRWGKLLTEDLRDVSGDPLGKSSLEKKMKLWRCFPKSEDEKRAVAIGVRRNDQICRIPASSCEPGKDGEPDPKRRLRDVILAEGWEVKGKIFHVEDFTVPELKKRIDKLLKKNGHGDKVKSPQAEFVAAFNGLAKKLADLLEKHSETLSMSFRPEEGSTLETAGNSITESVALLKNVKVEVAETGATDGGKAN